MNTLVSPISILLSIPVLLVSTYSFSQHEEKPHEIDEIIVTSALNQSKADTALPVHVLSDEALREQAANTLGETLRQLPGVHTSSFGVGVGQPVIRGLSGNRVGILQNSVAVLDAAGVSQDHASAMEPLLAERVEVLRGPATLLYGNGAIGGVVNVIDNRIPRNVEETFQGAVEIRGQSVNNGRTAVIKLEGRSQALSWHLDGLARRADDTEIPGFAVDQSNLTEPVDENSRGKILNSRSNADQFSGGGSWEFNNSWFGISLTQMNNNYGIPPGAHGHEEDEEEIRIDMEQQRIEAEGESTLIGWFKSLKWQVSNNQYAHKELEGQEIGTRFINEGWESRFSLDFDRQVNQTGSLGLQWLNRDFSAIGEEAFIPAVNIESLGLFAVENTDFDSWVLELGARIDKQVITTQNSCSTNETSYSASVSALWHWSDQLNVFASLNRSERPASVEEVFSNVDLITCASQTDLDNLVVHAATTRAELGSSQLTTETSNNFEIGFNKHRGDLKFEMNAYVNQFDNFIYLADIGLLTDGETIISQYQQDDAHFIGLEGKVSWLHQLETGGHLDFTLIADTIKAKLDDGSAVPRIPPAKIGLEFAWILDRLSAKVMATQTNKQKKLSVNESPTDGYLRWDFYSDYHWLFDKNELLLFLKLNNISDQEIRDHTSFLKNFAPAAGRGAELGIRFSF